MAQAMNDYLLDADNDLKITGGDWEAGESTYQHQRRILMSAPGEYKARPTVGVGIERFQDDEDSGDVKRTIAQQFMQDGMTVNDLRPNPESLTDNEVNVFNNSYYE